MVLGWTLALLAGVTQALIFITSRKSGNTPVVFLVLSTSIAHAVVCAILPYTPLVDDFPVERLAASPYKALAVIALLFMAMALSSVFNSAGAKWCPAAVSATMTTAAAIVFGYAAQLLLFDGSLELHSLVGSTLMLLAVVVTTLKRVPKPPVHPVLPVADGFSAVVTGELGAQGIDDDNAAESLAAFIAAEFAERAAHEQSPKRRIRHRATAVAPQTVGALSSVVAATG